jgi:hypothetical protein
MVGSYDVRGAGKATGFGRVKPAMQKNEPFTGVFRPYKVIL